VAVIPLAGALISFSMPSPFFFKVSRVRNRVHCLRNRIHPAAADPARLSAAYQRMSIEEKPEKSFFFGQKYGIVYQ
jgi:hypothetical protein